MTLVPIALFWLLVIWGALSRGPMLLYLFFGSMAFGSMAILPHPLTIGLTLTATPVFSMVIVAKALMARSGPSFFLKAALSMRQLGLLFFFWITAVLGTAALPRLFAGTVMVVPLRGELDITSPLEPTPQNISQLIYITISILTVFAFTRVLRTPADRQVALKAMVFGGAVVALTGIVDWLGQYLPLKPLLDLFRTATYSLATDVSVLGGKRVVGLMPEASAYGGLALGFLSMLIFFRRAIADRRVRDVYAPIIIGLLVVLCYLAKSSGTYLGLALLAVVIAAEALLRAFSGGRTRGLYRQDLVGEISVVLGLIVFVGIVVIAQPAVVDPVYELLDRMVFQKSETESFKGRGMWRTTAMESVVATGGLGVGVGSTRASSHIVAIFASTGLLGGLLYLGFVLQSLLRRSSHMDWEGQFILAGFRFSYLPIFAVSSLVGGTDFGAMNAFGFGIVTALVISQSKRERRRQNLRMPPVRDSRPPPRRVALR